MPPIYSSEFFCTKRSLFWLISALAIAILPPFIIVELEKQVDEARFASLCVTERQYLLVSNLDLAAAEKLWRDELNNHKCNPSHDWLNANCSLKLADVLTLNAKSSEEPYSAEAVKLYKDAARTFENLNAVFEAASAYESLGDYYQTHDKLEDAELCFQKSIEGYNQSRSKFCYYSQEVVSSLVDMYVRQKRYGDAINLLTEQLAAIRARKTEGPIADGLTLFELGKVYSAKGSYEEAKNYFREALVQGTPHPNLVISFIAFGENKLGHKKEAEIEYKKVVEYERATLKNRFAGLSSPWNLGSALEDLGEFYMEDKRVDEAIPLLQEAFTIRQNEFSSNDVFPMSKKIKVEALKKISTSLAAAYHSQGNESFAREVLKTAERY